MTQTAKTFTVLIGEPGIGKTTLARAIFEPYRGVGVQRATPFAHVVYPHNVVEIGIERGEFSGTDALPMNVGPTILDWLATTRATAVWAEGDRLCNEKTFKAAKAAGFRLECFVLRGPVELAAARRAERAARVGKAQDEAWVKGRITKVNKIASGWGFPILDATTSTQELCQRLASESTVIRQLAGNL